MSRSFSVLLIVASCFLAAARVPAAEPDPTPTIESIRELVAEGEYEQARVNAAGLTDVMRSAGRDASPELADLLDLFVEASWRGGDASEPATREAAARALAIRRAAADGPDVRVAGTLHQMGVVDFFLGDYDHARAEWQEALEIRRTVLGAEHPDVADSLNALANLSNILGEFAAARTYYEEALAVREKALGPDDFRVAQTLNNIAVLLTGIGDYAAALPLAERSLRIKQKSLGAEHPEVGSSLNSVGDLYDLTGDSARALELFERAAAVWEEALGPDHTLVGVALNNLAEQHRRAGRFDEARPSFERVLQIWEREHGSEHERVALVSSNLALLLAATGETDGAVRLHRRALAIREEAYGTEHPEVSESLVHLADVLTSLGRYDEARPLYERALGIWRAALGDDYPGLVDGQLGLAMLKSLAGETKAAFELALEAEAIGRDHLRLTGRSLAEEHALRYAAGRRSGLDLALSVAVLRPDALDPRALLDAIVRSRAVVLDEMAARNRSVNAAADPRIALLAAELSGARSRLANLVVRGLGDLEPEDYRSLLDATREEKEQAERALATASLEFARQQQRARYGLDDVAARLPEGAALVSYVQYNHMDVASVSAAPEASVRSYAAVVLRSDGGADVVALGPAASLERSVTSWKREVSRGTMYTRRTPEQAESLYRSEAEALRRAAWDPVAGRLGATQRVFLVPDGSLNLVSFAALPTADHDYLIESGPTLHYLSAERDLVPDAAAVTGHGLLVVGAPDYDDRSVFAALAAAPGDAPARPGAGGATRSAACGGFDSLRFDPLPGARLESAEIASLWQAAAQADAAPRDGVTALDGAAASEAAFKRDVGGRRVVHLATHGFFLGGDCAAGGTRSRGMTIVAEPQAPVVNVSPLLLSGLALAGANRRSAASPGEDDGVLTAEEIAGLDLSGVEWAVLSACDTGVGEIQAGEGVFGLRRAMQLAGVRTLIMSLWPVDDEATRSWMTALYRGRLTERLDSAEAVRHAGRSVLDARRDAGESTHPFFWAAFVGAGGWR